ncbi:MAG: VOC family protein [Myxococcota bacterium]
MHDPFVSRVGGVLSADIAVPEHERQIRFYSQILSTGESPLWREDLMNNRGIPVIGLGARTAEHADLPLQWMPHIQVADIAASVERAMALSGSELMHGRNEAGQSQWAVLRDPNGAAFGLIPVVPPEALPQPGDVPSGEGSARVGCISWLDLTVPNASEICDFYRQVVGWSVEEVEMKEADERYSDYTMLAKDGRPAAGICHARGANLGLPPVWLIYLPVGELDESLRRVREGGGQVVKEVGGPSAAYTFAVIRDPVGSYLALGTG